MRGDFEKCHRCEHGESISQFDTSLPEETKFAPDIPYCKLRFYNNSEYECPLETERTYCADCEHRHTLVNMIYLAPGVPWGGVLDKVICKKYKIELDNLADKRNSTIPAVCKKWRGKRSKPKSASCSRLVEFDSKGNIVIEKNGRQT
jgi:hypothetical protein